MKTGRIILFFLLVCFETGYTQTWAWAKSGIGTGNDESYGGVCTDATGNVFITGSYTSTLITFGTYSLTGTGNGDIFLTKYDSNGNVIWAKSSVGSGVGDVGYSVNADPMGNVYLTGYFTGLTIILGSYTLTNNGGQSVFLVKYDVNGNVLWAKSSIGSNSDYGFSVSTDVSGNAYITGGFTSTSIAFGSYTLTNSGNSAIFLVKYDSNGNVLWAKNSIGTIGDLGYSVSTDAGGNAYIAGFFSSSTIAFGSFSLTISGLGNSDIFLAKYDSNGNVLWAKSSVASGFGDGDLGYSVSTDVSGNSYITGVFTSSTIAFGSYSLTNSGGYNNNNNTFLTKYDTNGNVLWAKNSSGSSHAWSVSTNSNSVYICGSFLNDTLIIDTYTLIAPVGSTDPMFFARYDSNGNATYATYLTSGGDDWSGICVDKFCNVYLTGDYYGVNFIVGTNTLIATGVENVFVAKLSIPLPTVTASSSSSIICAEQSATLTALGASTYSWNPSGIGSTIVVTPTITSTYTVTGTSTLTGCQNSAIITESVNICEGIKEFNSNNNQISVFPNPNKGSFKIQMDNEIENGEVILINSLGQTVHEQKILRGENEINANKISNGLFHYIILQNKQQVGNGKLIIE